MIKTYYYKPNKRWGRNFGDELVVPILHWISGGEEVKHVNRKTDGKVLCIGSGLVNEGVLRKGDTIWGYGARYEKFIPVPEGIRFLAVRGPKTQRLFPDVCPEIYGDPAIFMPDIYKPKKLEKTYSVGIIPHYIDWPIFKDKKVFIEDPSILLINVTQPYKDTIDQINACDRIISTSLHGCIAAEAYGKPTAWLSVSNRILGAHFKFNDYLQGSGRAATDPNKFAYIWSILKAKSLPKPTYNKKGLLEAWKTNHL